MELVTPGEYASSPEFEDEMQVTVRNNPVIITDETIQATRKWFAENARACRDAAISGEYRVNDLPRYVQWQNQSIEQSLRGEWDYTLAFQQRALYIQTGESVPLL